MIRQLLILSLLLTSQAVIAAQDVELAGQVISTVDKSGTLEDGVYVANATLPNEDLLVVPYYFEGEPGETGLTITFDGTELEIVGGLPLSVETYDQFMVDIKDERAMAGEFVLTLSSSGTETARLMLVDGISAVTAVESSPSASGDSGGAWSGLTGLLLLLGVARRRRSA
jgi:MYXO-CTERM domain-containing protein